MRIRNFRFTSGAFVGLFTEGDHHYKLDNPLPDDAQVVRVSHDQAMGVFNIWIMSASFDEVPEGIIPPDQIFSATNV
jgi:hypothetical protein